MELDEYQTLKLVQDRMALKLYSHSNWPDFITWVKSITSDNFKAFAVASIIEILGDRDNEKAELLDAKALIEGTS